MIMASRRTKHTVKPLRRKLLSLMSFPACVLSGVPYIELQGDTSMAITGYESLLLYDEQNILFRMKDPTNPHFTLLRITGHDLTLSVLREGCLSVCGHIESVILHPKDIGTT